MWVSSRTNPIPPATAITKQTPNKSRAPLMVSSIYLASPCQLIAAIINPEIKKNGATSVKPPIPNPGILPVI